MAEVFTLLGGVPEYDGKPEELEIFIKHIDEIRQHAEPAMITLFDIRIRNKIVGRANIALINNNNPFGWDGIKLILKANFNISESVESLVNKIKTSECKTTIVNLYDYLMDLLTKLNLKNSIAPNEWYSCERNEAMVLKIFINKLPSEPKLILNARNPNSLLKAREILIETDYFYRNFNNKKSNLQPSSSNGNFNNSFKNNGKYQKFDNGNQKRNSGSSQSRNFSESFDNLNSNENVVNNSGNFAGNQGNLNRNQGGASGQRSNFSRQTPMDVDAVHTINFQSGPEELFPA